jgi:hypothetical protein
MDPHSFHAPQGFWPLLTDGKGAVLYCFIFLFLASAGEVATYLAKKHGGS